MPRKEKFRPGGIYHICNRGTEKRTVFEDELDYERCLAGLYIANSTTNIELSEKPGLSLGDQLWLERGNPLVEIGPYCLMPNHLHLTLREVEPGGVARFVHKFTTGYSCYFNARHRRGGRLFQGPYRAKEVKDNRYLLHLAGYIHANPKKISQHTNYSPQEIFEVLKRYGWSSLPDYLAVERPERRILGEKFIADIIALGFTPEWFFDFLSTPRPVGEAKAGFIGNLF